PEWFPRALELFKSIEGEAWQGAIELWASMERQAAFGGDKPPRFGTDKRPPQIARWFSYGRLYTTDPPIPDMEEYESSVQAWWTFLQPTWCTSSRPLPLPTYSPPPGSDWAKLQLSGPNGLLLVMMLFVWWGRALKLKPSTPSWFAATVDLRGVLQGMHEAGETLLAPG
ncbi:hypothetical protein BDN71DRAFT_1400516, partial [Pleurotus eryngii]